MADDSSSGNSTSTELCDEEDGDNHMEIISELPKDSLDNISKQTDHLGMLSRNAEQIAINSQDVSKVCVGVKSSHLIDYASGNTECYSSDSPCEIDSSSSELVEVPHRDITDNKHEDIKTSNNIEDQRTHTSSEENHLENIVNKPRLGEENKIQELRLNTKVSRAIEPYEETGGDLQNKEYVLHDITNNSLQKDINMVDDQNRNIIEFNKYNETKTLESSNDTQRAILIDDRYNATTYISDTDDNRPTSVEPLKESDKSMSEKSEHVLQVATSEINLGTVETVKYQKDQTLQETSQNSSNTGHDPTVNSQIKDSKSDILTVTNSSRLEARCRDEISPSVKQTDALKQAINPKDFNTLPLEVDNKMTIQVAQMEASTNIAGRLEQVAEINTISSLKPTTKVRTKQSDVSISADLVDGRGEKEFTSFVDDALNVESEVKLEERNVVVIDAGKESGRKEDINTVNGEESIMVGMEGEEMITAMDRKVNEGIIYSESELASISNTTEQATNKSGIPHSKSIGELEEIINSVAIQESHSSLLFNSPCKTEYSFQETLANFKSSIENSKLSQQSPTNLSRSSSISKRSRSSSSVSPRSPRFCGYDDEASAFEICKEAESIRQYIDSEFLSNLLIKGEQEKVRKKMNKKKAENETNSEKSARRDTKEKQKDTTQTSNHTSNNEIRKTCDSEDSSRNLTNTGGSNSDKIHSNKQHLEQAEKENIEEMLDDISEVTKLEISNRLDVCTVDSSNNVSSEETHVGKSEIQFSPQQNKTKLSENLALNLGNDNTEIRVDISEINICNLSDRIANIHIKARSDPNSPNLSETPTSFVESGYNPVTNLFSLQVPELEDVPSSSPSPTFARSSFAQNSQFLRSLSISTQELLNTLVVSSSFDADHTPSPVNNTTDDLADSEMELALPTLAHTTSLAICKLFTAAEEIEVLEESATKEHVAGAETIQSTDQPIQIEDTHPKKKTDTIKNNETEIKASGSFPTVTEFDNKKNASCSIAATYSIDEDILLHEKALDNILDQKYVDPSTFAYSLSPISNYPLTHGRILNEVPTLQELASASLPSVRPVSSAIISFSSYDEDPKYIEKTHLKRRYNSPEFRKTANPRLSLRDKFERDLHSKKRNKKHSKSLSKNARFQKGPTARVTSQEKDKNVSKLDKSKSESRIGETINKKEDDFVMEDRVKSEGSLEYKRQTTVKFAPLNIEIPHYREPEIDDVQTEDDRGSENDEFISPSDEITAEMIRKRLWAGLRSFSVDVDILQAYGILSNSGDLATTDSIVNSLPETTLTDNDISYSSKPGSSSHQRKPSMTAEDIEFLETKRHNRRRGSVAALQELVKENTQIINKIGEQKQVFANEETLSELTPSKAQQYNKDTIVLPETSTITQENINLDSVTVSNRDILKIPAVESKCVSNRDMQEIEKEASSVSSRDQKNTNINSESMASRIAHIDPTVESSFTDNRRTLEPGCVGSIYKTSVHVDKVTTIESAHKASSQEITTAELNSALNTQVVARAESVILDGQKTPGTTRQSGSSSEILKKHEMKSLVIETSLPVSTLNDNRSANVKKSDNESELNDQPLIAARNSSANCSKMASTTPTQESNAKDNSSHKDVHECSTKREIEKVSLHVFAKDERGSQDISTTIVSSPATILPSTSISKADVPNLNNTNERTSDVDNSNFQNDVKDVIVSQKEPCNDLNCFKLPLSAFCVNTSKRSIKVAEKDAILDIDQCSVINKAKGTNGCVMLPQVSKSSPVVAQSQLYSTTDFSSPSKLESCKALKNNVEKEKVALYIRKDSPSSYVAHSTNQPAYSIDGSNILIDKSSSIKHQYSSLKSSDSGTASSPRKLHYSSVKSSPLGSASPLRKIDYSSDGSSSLSDRPLKGKKYDFQKRSKYSTDEAELSKVNKCEKKKSTHSPISHSEYKPRSSVSSIASSTSSGEGSGYTSASRTSSSYLRDSASSLTAAASTQRLSPISQHSVSTSQRLSPINQRSPTTNQRLSPTSILAISPKVSPSRGCASVAKLCPSPKSEKVLSHHPSKPITFNPFPTRSVTLQRKEVPLKLGLYSPISK